MQAVVLGVLGAGVATGYQHRLEMCVHYDLSFEKLGAAVSEYHVMLSHLPLAEVTIYVDLEMADDDDDGRRGQLRPPRPFYNTHYDIPSIEELFSNRGIPTTIRNLPLGTRCTDRIVVI